MPSGQPGCGCPALTHRRALLSLPARRTSSSRNSLARNSRGRKTTRTRRRKRRRSKAAPLPACLQGQPPGWAVDARSVLPAGPQAVQTPPPSPRPAAMCSFRSSVRSPALLRTDSEPRSRWQKPPRCTATPARCSHRPEPTGAGEGRHREGVPEPGRAPAAALLCRLPALRNTVTPLPINPPLQPGDKLRVVRRAGGGQPEPGRQGLQTAVGVGGRAERRPLLARPRCRAPSGSAPGRGGAEVTRA